MIWGEGGFHFDGVTGLLEEWMKSWGSAKRRLRA